MTPARSSNPHGKGAGAFFWSCRHSVRGPPGYALCRCGRRRALRGAAARAGRAAAGGRGIQPDRKGESPLLGRPRQSRCQSRGRSWRRNCGHEPDVGIERESRCPQTRPAIAILGSAAAAPVAPCWSPGLPRVRRQTEESGAVVNVTLLTVFYRFDGPPSTRPRPGSAAGCACIPER